MDAVTVDVDVEFILLHTHQNLDGQKEFVYVGNGLCQSLGPRNEKIDRLNFVK